MEATSGEAQDAALGLVFDRRLKLEFHGTRITSDGGLLACRELDDTLGLSDTVSGCLGRDVWLGPPVEVCPGFELIAIENAAALGHDSLEISKGREAQMIRHMRHGSPPRPWHLSLSAAALSGNPCDSFRRKPYYRRFHADEP